MKYKALKDCNHYNEAGKQDYIIKEGSTIEVLDILKPTSWGVVIATCPDGHIIYSYKGKCNFRKSGKKK